MKKMESQIAQSLNEYATIMKKQLILSIGLGVLAFFAIFALFGDSLGLLLIIGLLMFILLIVFLVYFVQMISRLGRAKNLSMDPLLINAYNIQIASIIVNIISFFITGTGEVVLSILGTFLNILMIKYIVEFMFKYSKDDSQSHHLNSLKKGYNLLLLSSVAQIILIIVQLILMYSLNLSLLIVLGVIALILAIVSVLGQFQIANGIIGVTESFGASSNPYNQQYRSQNQYGNPTRSAYYQEEYDENEKYREQPSYNQDEYGQPPSFNRRNNSEDFSDDNLGRTTHYPRGIGEDQTQKNTTRCKICDTEVVKQNQQYCSNCGAPLE